MIRPFPLALRILAADALGLAGLALLKLAEFAEVEHETTRRVRGES